MTAVHWGKGVEMESHLNELLDTIRDDIKDELANMPEVEEKSAASFAVDKLPKSARRWHKLEDLVAVAVDLKGSSRLSVGKYPASTASIYEASTDNAVRVFHEFEADFLQIQGDGVIALFWGDKRYERALCAGITVKTFSVDFAARVAEKWPDAPRTGYKVGIANGRVLVKMIGTPKNIAEQEPIWSGKPVNYAVKAAQTADVDQLIVSGGVWDEIENNDYLTTSCAHDGSLAAPLWDDRIIEHVPDEDDARYGRMLNSSWCNECGEKFCDAILAGLTDRDEAAEAAAADKAARAQNLEHVYSKRRQHRTQHQIGMTTR
jgi:class 3 adenylate cyclase